MDNNLDHPNNENESTQPSLNQTGSSLSSVQRLWMMFSSPSLVFEDIKRKPTWVLALICYVVVVVTSSLVVYSNMDHEANVRNQLEMMNIEVPEEQIENSIEGSEKRWFLKPVLGALFVPLSLVIAAALFFLMLKLTGSDVGYLETFSTVIHAYWPSKLVFSVLLAALVSARGSITELGLPQIVKSSLAGFLPSDAPLHMLTFGSFFDVFKIWGIVLLVIGFGVVAKVSRGRAVIASLTPWIFLIVISTLLSALPAIFAR